MRLITAVVAFGSWAAAAAAAGDATLLFQPPLNLPTGQTEYVPDSIAIGDFNRDSKPDIAVANSTPGPISTLTIFLNAGNRSFFPAQNVPAGENPKSLQAADFDEDGALDLAAADQAGTTVSLWRGDGAGHFDARRTFFVGIPGASGLAAADVNGDGHVDLMASLYTYRAENGGLNLVVLPGDGTGGFGPPRRFPAGAYPTAIVVGDWNRDAKPDLAVANFNSANSSGEHTISVYLNDGSGGFPSIVEYALGPNPIGVETGDFNADGKPDLAAVHSGGHPVGGGGGAVFLGNGDGTFVRFFTLPLDPANEAGQPSSVAAGDFDSDGGLDLAVTRTGAISDVLVFRGDGTGRFAPPVSFPAHLAPQKVRVGDFDSDRRPDLAITNGRSFDVSILFNGSFSGIADVPVLSFPAAAALAAGLACAALWWIRRSG